jgi:hypothetical protein
MTTFNTDKGTRGARAAGSASTIKATNPIRYANENSPGHSYHYRHKVPIHANTQHRFMVTTIQGNAAEWAKQLAGAFGARGIAESVHRLVNNFVGTTFTPFR